MPNGLLLEAESAESMRYWINGIKSEVHVLCRQEAAAAAAARQHSSKEAVLLGAGRRLRMRLYALVWPPMHEATSGIQIPTHFRTHQWARPALMIPSDLTGRRRSLSPEGKTCGIVVCIHES